MSFHNRLNKLIAAAAALSLLAGCSTTSSSEAQSSESSQAVSEEVSSSEESSSEESVPESSSEESSDSDSENTDQAKIKVLCPQGAPALSTLGIDENTASVEYTEGQDILISELAKKDGEYDVIIAPINLGVKSWSQAENYTLDGVVTWGNLYIVGTESDWNTEGNTVAAFGEGAVPSMVFNEVYPELQCEVSYYPSVAEASQALISGQVNTALLAMPVAMAAKNKTEGADIQADLQALWQEDTGSAEKGYPQAAVFVKKGEEAAGETIAKEIQDFTSIEDENEQKQAVLDAVEAIGADVLGVPSAEMAANTWTMQNIHYEDALSVESDIETFLKVFDMELPNGIIQ